MGISAGIYSGHFGPLKSEQTDKKVLTRKELLKGFCGWKDVRGMSWKKEVKQTAAAEGGIAGGINCGGSRTSARLQQLVTGSLIS